MRHVTRWLALSAVAACGCAKLPEPIGAGALAREPLPDSTAVPAAWGSLISVTVNQASPDVYQLWFQDPAGNVRLVVYPVRLGRLGRTARVITRR
jgi:hypothetical protein